MKPKYSLFFFVVVLISQTVSGKDKKSVPGYLGSRNCFSIKAMPNVIFLNKVLEGFSTDFTEETLHYPSNAYHLTHPTIGFTYERVYNRRNSICISAGTSSGIYDENTDYGYRMDAGRDFGGNYPYIHSNGVHGYLEWMKGKISYRNDYISLAKTFYISRTGSIAPQGKYVKMGLSCNFYKIKRDEFKYTLNSDAGFIEVSNTEENHSTKKLFSINFERGSKRFITKHLFFQSAVAFNVPLRLNLSSNHDIAINKYSEKQLGSYIAGLQLFNFSLALGFAL